MEKILKAIGDMKQEAFLFIDRNNKEITKIGDAVFYFAELGMQEFKTSEYTADALRMAGFNVEMGISGIPPCVGGHVGFRQTCHCYSN